MQLKQVISTLIMSSSLFINFNYGINSNLSAHAATSKVPAVFKHPANWVTNYQKIKAVKIYSYAHQKKLTARYVRINNNFSGGFGFNPIYYYYSKNKHFIANSNVINANAGAYPKYTFINKHHYRLDSGIGNHINHYQIKINHSQTITIWLISQNQSHRIGTFHHYPDGNKKLSQILKTKF